MRIGLAMAESTEKVPYSNYRITVRLQIQNKPHMFSRVVQSIARSKAVIAGVDLVEVSGKSVIRDVTLDVANVRHGYQITEKLGKARGVVVVSVSDQIFLMHLGGKISVQSKYPVTTRNRLSMVYTPGVARVARAVHDHPSSAYNLTVKNNSVAVVTDGSAVLGLGNLGAFGSIPVMEGKAMIFREFAGINAWPICLDTQDVDEIVRTVKNIAPVFGAINLEDISAPRCFEIEDRLKEELDIPVMHDDQHGTAIAVLAALRNALKIVKKDLRNVRIVVNGMGAAGIACTRLLLAAGARHLIGCDRRGAILTAPPDQLYRKRRELLSIMHWDKPEMSLRQALSGADVLIGLSSGNILRPRDLKVMRRNNIVFAMANPDPEVDPFKAISFCRVIATGRSDFPNQINNALVFPGLFRGVLNVRASAISESMKLAAADALAKIVKRDALSEEYIIPSLFDKRIVERMSEAVGLAAQKAGLARRNSKQNKSA
jgi:malate dehydrogenase (oxaloacetate-decarboxylating)